MSKILGKGTLPSGYGIFLKTEPYVYSKEDTEQDIITALDSMFEDVHAFERDVLNKWNDVQ